MPPPFKLTTEAIDDVNRGESMWKQSPEVRLSLRGLGREQFPDHHEE